MPNFHTRFGDAYAERLVDMLATHPDFRVLRRLPHLHEMWLHPTPHGGPHLTLAVIDTETTGLDPDHDAMFELAIVRMGLDRDGHLVELTPPFAMLEDPGRAVPADILDLTGIDAGELRGQRFDERTLARTIAGVDVMVSHHAAFDRAFFTRRFGGIELPWACTLHDMDWRAQGLEGRALGHLLASAGYSLTGAHRAGTDAWALACLLARIADDGRATAAHLVERARQPTWRLYAHRAPFAMKDVLKRIGYRWDSGRRVWWIDGDDEKIAGETVFLQSLGPPARPQVERIDWHNRYRR